eukprot:4759099-Prymnesium_polylepis.2
MPSRGMGCAVSQRSSLISTSRCAMTALLSSVTLATKRTCDVRCVRGFMHVEEFPQVGVGENLCGGLTSVDVKPTSTVLVGSTSPICGVQCSHNSPGRRTEHA